MQLQSIKMNCKVWLRGISSCAQLLSVSSNYDYIIFNYDIILFVTLTQIWPLNRFTHLFVFILQSYLFILYVS